MRGLVERNNRIGNLIVDEAFNLWTDGKVGAYVRFVVDGQRFGFHPETEIAAREVKIGDDVYVCPDCGAETPADADVVFSRAHGMPCPTRQSAIHAHQRRPLVRVRRVPASHSRRWHDSSPSSTPAHGSRRDSLGLSRTERRYHLLRTAARSSPKKISSPRKPSPSPPAETRLRVPNGQEVITIVGGLELKTPPWANEMHEYPYLQWNMEVHQARLRAAYPHAADKIGAPVASGMQEYERLARLAQSQGGPLTEGGDFNINLITFQRTWLRPWAFFALDDKSLRDELLATFPRRRLRRIRGRRLLRIAQRKYGRSLARAPRAAR